MSRTLFAGAEVRVDPETLDPAWDAARRETYLLRRDIRRPLSVDRRVWPTCPMADGQSAPAMLPWVSVAEVEAQTQRQPHAVTIVIGLVIESADDEALAASQGIDSEVVVEPRWRLLGFDIADGTAISGLSNCGYEANEADALRKAWAARLNEHGLFDDVRNALAFRAIADARVREHAPFAVYAMWMLDA